VFATLMTKPSFWLLCLGAACSSMMGYGLFFWLPSFFVRSFGISLLDASLGYGAILLVGGLFGIWMGGFLSDRLARRSKAAYALVPAAAFIGTLASHPKHCGLRCFSCSFPPRSALYGSAR
jgi:sugar phosphate permease